MDTRLKILITGGKGYIAKSLYSNLRDRHNITLLTRSDFDLTDLKSCNQWFNKRQFDVVLHTAITGGNRLKIETGETLDKNLQMYYNLLANKEHFNKFINFGSGAELLDIDTPYSLSKKAINKSIKDKPNFYNIRIFAVFDENELNQRFIKANILRYKNNKSLVIHQNKKMDFFYIKDLINLVKHYIENNNLPKEIDCTYEKTFTLKQIATFINSLDKHKSDIIIENINTAKQYCGTFTQLIPYIGLKKGIKKMYEII
jgi:nucleoside-diphosphate-sugar epimerase